MASYARLFCVLLIAGVPACSDGTKARASSTTPDAGEPDESGTPDLPALPSNVALPIIFLHGFVGSAQQYESQAIRFVANGYPRERIQAIDHHGVSPDTNALMADVVALGERLCAEAGVDKFFLVGHSRGTSMSNTFLSDPARAAKVAKYISLDGGGCGVAMGAGVECLAPHQTRAGAPPDATGIPGQAHVEISTSAESFKMQYQFLVGEAPKVVDIVQQSGRVTLSGRVVDFPANTGRGGTTLRVWEVDAASGERTEDEPVKTFSIADDGEWGPLQVSPKRFYEFALDTPGAGTQHFYPQRFLRSSHLVRLLSGDPATSTTRMNTNSGPNHSAFVAIRMREWYATDDADLDGDDSDVLEITVKRPAGDVGPINAIQSFVGNGAIALHIHDDAVTPKESSLVALASFAGQPFQGGVDVFMPASEPPDGSITVKNVPRGKADRPQVLNFPNWASDNHFISLMFADYPVD